MLEYFYFSYLIRIVVFIDRYRSPECCTVLSGNVSQQICCCAITERICSLVAEHFLDKYDRNESLSFFGYVNVLVELERHVFFRSVRCLSFLVAGIVLQRVCDSQTNFRFL